MQFADRKHDLRADCRQRRISLEGRDRRSAQINRRLLELAPYRSARQRLLYVGCRSEVRTDLLLTQNFDEAGYCVLPFCEDGLLHLVRVRSWRELERGAYGIPEPVQSVRGQPDRSVDPRTIDLAVIPAVAFDRTGNRLGQGAGYYDRLIPLLSEHCRLIGLAFDCQLVAAVPIEPHDRPVHWIVTESELINCS